MVYVVSDTNPSTVMVTSELALIPVVAFEGTYSPLAPVRART